MRHSTGRFILAVLAALLLAAFMDAAPATAAVAAGGDRAAKGDELYAARAEGHSGEVASADVIKKAIAEYMAAYGAGDHSASLIERIMRANYFYATYTNISPEEQKKVFEHSIRLGEEALAKDPGSVAINYQIAGAWGRWGEVNGIIASARQGVADKIKAYGEKVVAKDARFADGGGYRTLGRLHFKVPRIPFVLSWPSNAESEKFLAKAVEAGPANLTNHLFYAETLYENGSVGRALEEAQFVVSSTPRADHLVEDLRDQKDARALIGKLRGGK